MRQFRSRGKSSAVASQRNAYQCLASTRGSRIATLGTRRARSSHVWKQRLLFMLKLCSAVSPHSSGHAAALLRPCSEPVSTLSRSRCRPRLFAFAHTTALQPLRPLRTRNEAAPDAPGGEQLRSAVYRCNALSMHGGQGRVPPIDLTCRHGDRRVLRFAVTCTAASSSGEHATTSHGARHPYAGAPTHLSAEAIGANVRAPPNAAAAAAAATIAAATTAAAATPTAAATPRAAGGTASAAAATAAAAAARPAEWRLGRCAA